MTKEPINVVGAVFHKDGLVFATRRGPGKTMDGKWEFPGGKIEDGETPKEALVRELKEELLIDAHVADHIVTVDHEYDFGVVRLSTYFCEIASGEPTLTEHSEARWIPLAQLHEYDWAPADLPTISALTQNQ